MHGGSQQLYQPPHLFSQEGFKHLSYITKVVYKHRLVYSNHRMRHMLAIAWSQTRSLHDKFQTASKQLSVPGFTKCGLSRPCTQYYITAPARCIVASTIAAKLFMVTMVLRLHQLSVSALHVSAQGTEKAAKYNGRMHCDTPLLALYK